MLAKLKDCLPIGQSPGLVLKELSNIKINACRMLVYRGCAEVHTNDHLTLSFRLTERGHLAHEELHVAAPTRYADG